MLLCVQVLWFLNHTIFLRQHTSKMIFISLNFVYFETIEIQGITIYQRSPVGTVRGVSLVFTVTRNQCIQTKPTCPNWWPQTVLVNKAGNRIRAALVRGQGVQTYRPAGQLEFMETYAENRQHSTGKVTDFGCRNVSKPPFLKHCYSLQRGEAQSHQDGQLTVVTHKNMVMTIAKK